MNNKELLKAIEMLNIMKDLKLKYALAPICVIIIAVIGFYNSDMFTLQQNLILLFQRKMIGL